MSKTMPMQPPPSLEMEMDDGDGERQGSTKLLAMPLAACIHQMYLSLMMARPVLGTSLRLVYQKKESPTLFNSTAIGPADHKYVYITMRSEAPLGSRRRQKSGSTSSQCVLVVIGALLVLISLWFNFYSSLGIDLPHNDAQIKGSAASNGYFTEYVDNDVKVEKTSATAAVATLKNYIDEREREVDNMISTNG
eukprot:scaffold20817_cov147-Skeletonema_dohrnii-CCMP3373.AAC.2